jgi:hypothetical protein
VNWCVNQYGTSCKSIQDALKVVPAEELKDKETIIFWIYYSCLHSRDHVGCNGNPKQETPSTAELKHAECIACDATPEEDNTIASNKNKKPRKRKLTATQWLAVPTGCEQEKSPKQQLAIELYNGKMTLANQTSGGKNVNYARLWDDAKLEADKKAPKRRQQKEQKIEHDNKDADIQTEGEAAKESEV